ncbi:MAG: tRNA glutamyl-Q(34) synthetase GluQRS [Clostridia bacterium]|nr:tRNA glutamyl-Q(34) synthetase GluQRS [Clostridia bacterium]
MNDGITVGRFAPTPSGYMHAGNILCALMAYLSAKSAGGKFIVRIEDLDKLRCPEPAARDILELLDFLGLKSDAEIIYQSDRSDAYIAAIDKIASVANVYECFCTRAELHAATAPRGEYGEVVYSGTCKNLSFKQKCEMRKTRRPCLRLEVPNETITFVDGLQGEYRQNLAESCGDFILRRSDGVAAYQLAVVVDDGFQGVTEVVRGMDLISSTPRQIYIGKLLGLPQPRYMHIPLLKRANGDKLSKSAGDNVRNLLARHTPEELLGTLACAMGIIAEPRPSTAAELVKIYDKTKLRADNITVPENLIDDIRS